MCLETFQSSPGKHSTKRTLDLENHAAMNPGKTINTTRTNARTVSTATPVHPRAPLFVSVGCTAAASRDSACMTGNVGPAVPLGNAKRLCYKHEPVFFPLVTKLCLVTHQSWKLCFPSRAARDQITFEI